ncbi:hypothetical protein [Arthrobacter sp. NPDC090010]|uniref:hypothetical protein n=1 Tax=Arthrobacter sp. NPDC090010 TaxID=3363942 RepID=UPI00382F1E60
MSPRLYTLRSTWHLPAGPDRVWEIITDPGLTPGTPFWWPGSLLLAPLPLKDAHGSQQESLLRTTAQLSFRSGIGYRLNIAVHPTRVQRPSVLEFDADGDLQGCGALRLSAADDGASTRLEIEWTVRPTRRWMIVLSPLAAPVFTAAHARVMRRGEEGLTRLLQSGAP